MLFKREVGNWDVGGGINVINQNMSDNSTTRTIPDSSKYTQYSSSMNQLNYGNNTNTFQKGDVSNDVESND